MTDIIKMDYGKMESMMQTLKQVQNELQETSTNMRQISKTIDNGALLGQGGQAFEDAINSKLVPAIERLQRKFGELHMDVKKAMDDMKQADTQAKQQFMN